MELRAHQCGVLMMWGKLLDLFHKCVNGNKMNTNSYVGSSLEATYIFMAQLNGSLI